jgi:arylesterase/paraoxonase
VEEYLQLSKSYVMYYDGTAFRKVAGDLAYANGIAVSKDGRTLYVASVVGRYIRVYDRDMTSETLTPRQDIDLDTGVDNIEVDETGALWVGAHPKMLTFVKHAGDASVHAPSQVLRISSGGDGTFTVKEVYLNTGEALSASSVAAVYGNRMLIGAVFDDHFLDCTFSE